MASGETPADERPDMYDKATLKQLIAGAKRLGFQDDVEHWESELAKLERDEAN